MLGFDGKYTIQRIMVEAYAPRMSRPLYWRVGDAKLSLTSPPNSKCDGRHKEGIMWVLVNSTTAAKVSREYWYELFVTIRVEAKL